ncbi:glucose-6-phosphate dehydrogenase [Ornithinicoccus hortensis]|uniref:Glucose-6-phosphate 1-dehydrogenase n=1 Tax=Ornithinicoccus hortensis TaxID=82346 RepID=A0A542YM50_9MICO|nr:glucose-6-phosphate dehydrogenase [Ornithinicoccus hortensis]TQL49169.1 glucose-6-phosphate 1-dehydrogenase [Ornithinicoccus hortensis]
MSDPTTLVILGASGDLTSRLLLPGLASLLAVEPDRRVHVVGVDRAELDDAGWRAKVTEAFTGAGVPEDAAAEVAADARYVQADLLEQEQLAGLLDGLGGPLVLYFALPPQVSQKVCGLLERLELPEDTRLALEKPFGHELESAQELNVQLLKLVPEDRIHRVDHFLGVNTILNLIGIRFANRLLQPMWSAEHIERVVISYDETLALEGRAGYYDGAGALVDMIQSHLLQILAFFAMEAPASLDEVEVRSVKAQVLRATRVWGEDPTTASRRARYTAGRSEDRDVPSYVDEEGVDPANDTETLAEVVLEVANARWAGVPFVLRSGKALREPAKQVVVTFRPPRHVPTGLKDCTEPDQLILELKPGAVDVVLSMNAEGDPFELEQKVIRAELGKSRMLPYGEVLAGILDGDPLLSIRGDVAEDCWRIVDPVLAAWRAGSVPMQDYPAGSDGPDGWGVVPPRS